MGQTPSLRPNRQWLAALIAFVAMFGQLTVALAPLAEGRDGRMASHVEAHGAAGHFAHDEAKCVSCQARSMVGTTARPVPPIQAAITPRTEIVRDADAIAAVDHLQSSPRAPPFVN